MIILGIEAAVLTVLCLRMGRELRAKGWQNPLWMQATVVLGWFGGSFLGIFAANLVHNIYMLATHQDLPGQQGVGIFASIVCHFIGGAATEGILFFIVTRLPKRPTLNGPTPAPVVQIAPPALHTPPPLLKRPPLPKHITDK